MPHWIDKNSIRSGSTRRGGRGKKGKGSSYSADYDQEMHDFIYDVECSAKKILKQSSQRRMAEAARARVEMRRTAQRAEKQRRAELRRTKSAGGGPLTPHNRGRRGGGKTPGGARTPGGAEGAACVGVACRNPSP